GSTVNAAKLSLASNAVLAACDSLDGVTDGIIANVGACNYSVDALRCPGGADTGDSCLSDAQINVFKTETSRLTGGAGTPYVTSSSPYFLWGQESTPGSWASWILSDPSITGLFTDSMVKYLLAANPSADWVSYDYKANERIVQAMAAEIDVTDPNLN